MTPEDEKYVRSRKSASRGSTGLAIFSYLVLISAWGGLLYFLPQYLNPMLFFDKIQDAPVSQDTVHVFAGSAVVLFHVIWFLLLFIAYVCAKALRREARLIRIIEDMQNAHISKTGETGTWKLE